MKLLNNYILVKKAEPKKTNAFETVNGITKVLGYGEVVNAPEGEIKVGDRIYFEKTLGTEFDIDGTMVKFIKLS